MIEVYKGCIDVAYKHWASLVGKELDDCMRHTWLQQNYREFSTLLAIMRVWQPKKILELGFGLGGSALCFYHAFPQAIIVDVDILDFTNPSLSPKPEFQAGCKVAEFLRGTGRWFFFPSDSRDKALPVILSQQFGLFDVLFIDACHLKEYVINDYMLYSPLVRVGGLIAFHDTSLTTQIPGDREVNAALQELNIWYLNIEDKTPPATPGISYTVRGMER